MNGLISNYSYKYIVSINDLSISLFDHDNLTYALPDSIKFEPRECIYLILILTNLFFSNDISLLVCFSLISFS